MARTKQLPSSQCQTVRCCQPLQLATAPEILNAVLNNVRLSDKEFTSLGKAFIANEKKEKFNEIDVQEGSCETHNLTTKGVEVFALAVPHLSIAKFTLSCEYELNSKVTDI